MSVYLGSDKVGVTKELGTDRLQWKCDNMKSLRYEFYGYAGTEIPILKGLDTSKVTNMQYMFSSCKNVTSLDLSSFNTINVRDMSNFFDGSAGLTELDLSTFNTSNATSMYYMFKGCSNLTSLDLSTFDTSKVSDMGGMFRGCEKLETISNINMINISNVGNTLYDCKALKNLTIYNIKKSLSIGSSTSYGTLLTLDSLVHTIQQLWDFTGSTSQTLTMSTASKNLIANVYVKLVDVTDEMLAQDQYAANKKPCIVCESTDEGAMTLTEYATSKNWAIA